ncbi:putative membrane-associated tyrosine- and threonine-specific cdc2-inhibitory kinase [Apostichopus japonicus]|uniref:Membrane-associated tyrosine- and threonine-specific cdc2-inhibitory kinase n=1 Tax=Stichopus japonicus TaxID=307972 RepID=A0A2G8L040_STIJA|nr:putative membrane-associated tyrosine- and threonine-specific cdc2-inhibitory kinase [Apostichopus japonicus]
MHQFQNSFVVPDKSFSTPRPTPKFLPEVSFSQKKLSTRTPDDGKAAPRPPIKSAPPVSRLFFNRSHDEEHKPRAVSFHDPDRTGCLLQSPHYNVNSRYLFFDQCFDLISKLGEGSFGEVFKVQSREDGRFYAVKRSRERFRGEGDKRRKLEEVNKHEGLRKHINCVGFHKAWAERGHLYIQAELCQMSLREVCDLNHDIPEELTFKYLGDLIQGLKHLHDNDLLHLDVKPDNIFIGMDGLCKLGDFGLTVSVKSGELINAREGDAKYLAPELLEGNYSKAADVFSLGMTILELATDLEIPQHGDGWHQLRNGEIPWHLARDVSPELKSFVVAMLLRDYTQRPTLAQLITIPKIQRVLTSRWRELFLQQLKNKCFHILLVLWSFFLAIFYRIFSPLFSLKRKLFQTSAMEQKVIKTARQIRRPSDWDLSFSDDECFESDQSHSSFGVPLSNSSFSSEEDAPKGSSILLSKARFRFPLPRTPKSGPRGGKPIPRSSSPIARLSPQSRALRFGGSPNVSLLRSPKSTPRGTPFGSPVGTPSKVSSMESSMDEDSRDDSFQCSIGPRSLHMDFNEADESD